MWTFLRRRRSAKRVRLTRAHLEEDAGKSLHEDYDGLTGIDLNRAGTPLLEIVTEPDMRSSAEAVEYAKALHALVVWLGICDGNMQEGSFRCDANVSVRRPGAPLGTRREVKNLNSFRFLQQAIDFEVQWQIDRIEDGLAIEQATVLFDPDTGETRAMRSKEDAHDYRYFPDPDLPPLVIAPEWIERVRAEMPELPRGDGAALPARRRPARLRRGDDDAEPGLRALLRGRARRLRPAQAGGQLADGRGLAPAQRRRRAASTPARWARPRWRALIRRMADGTMSNNGARQVFDALWAGEGGDVDALIEAKGLKQMSDSRRAGSHRRRGASPRTPSRWRNTAPARTRPSTRWSVR